MLERLKTRLKGNVILGIGNILRNDDGAGSILASRIKSRVSFKVFDAGISPENYLDKIIKEKPDTLLLIDVADFGGSSGECRLLEADEIKTINLFSTHNTSLSLIINYLQTNLKADIIILLIQSKNIDFGDNLSPEITTAITKLEELFYDADKKKG